MEKRIELEAKFNKSRSNLLVVVALSAVNVILTLADASISFLFSAIFPMLSIEFGQILAEDLGNSVFSNLGIVLAFISIALYVLCYFLSKKHKAFMLVSLVLFSIDTLFLVWLLTFGVDFSIIIDAAFHVWVMYYLATGVKAWSGLKKLPPDEDVADNVVPENYDYGS